MFKRVTGELIGFFQARYIRPTLASRPTISMRTSFPNTPMVTPKVLVSIEPCRRSFPLGKTIRTLVCEDEISKQHNAPPTPSSELLIAMTRDFARCTATARTWLRPIFTCLLQLSIHSTACKGYVRELRFVAYKDTAMEVGVACTEIWSAILLMSVLTPQTKPPC